MKRKEEITKIVKSSIAEAIFKKMIEKKFSEITIKEICDCAGVARSSFYRNFKIKEDAIKYFLDDVLFDYQKNINIEENSLYDNLYETFKYVDYYKLYLKALFGSEFSQYLLISINNFMMNKYYDRIKNEYHIYAYSGALFNMMYHYVMIDKTNDYKKVTDEFFDSILNNSIFRKDITK